MVEDVDQEQKFFLHLDERIALVREINKRAWQNLPFEKRIAFIQLGRWLEKERLGFKDLKNVFCKICSEKNDIPHYSMVCHKCRNKNFAINQLMKAAS